MTVREYIQENWKNSIRKGEYKNLPYPYNSPSCEQTSDVGFENFFYWDTYFINLGLLCDGLEEQALNNIRNMIFLIGKYGYVPNVAVEGGDNRSQFPVFIPMCHAYWQYTGDKEFVREAYPAMKEEYAFWMRRRMLPCGLNRYGNNADAKTCGDFYKIITDSRLGKEVEKTEKDAEYLGSNLLSEAESGWDFTPRFNARAECFAPIDLNSLLYENEKILAFFGELLGEKNAYEEAAVRRAELIRRHCTVNGDFYDYASVRETCSPMISPALLMPYLCGLSDNAEKALRIIQRLQTKYGIPATEKTEEYGKYQWSYPNIWPPLVCLSVMALDRVGAKSEAKRLAKQYIDLVDRGWKDTGSLWEKYDCISGCKATVHEYAESKMLGWTAGTYRVFENYLSSGCMIHNFNVKKTEVKDEII